MAIHHNTKKRAARLGVEIVEIPGNPVKFRAIRLTDQATSIAYDSAPNLLDAVANDEISFESAPKGLKSGVMAMSYHVQYVRQGGGSGDALDCTLRDLIHESKSDPYQLVREIAEANGVWNHDWSHLNLGMQRMNLSNRLRAILRNNANATITIEGQSGRFGVAYKPNKREMRAALRAQSEHVEG